MRGTLCFESLLLLLSLLVGEDVAGRDEEGEK